MKRPGLPRALAGMVLLLSVCIWCTLPAWAGEDEAAASRQVLVMLRMPPPHFRAGADSGGYGTGSDPGQAARRRTAQLLAREHSLRIVDDWPMPVIGVDCYVMEGPGQAGPALLSALARDPAVAWAQPVNLFHGMEQAQHPGDPLAPLQPDGRLWHLAELHRVSIGDGVRVAVVDSGVDRGHPDLAQQVALEENFVGEGPSRPEVHGTAVAGVIAARMGNGVGIAGVAPGARLLALRACWETAGTPGARCSSFTLAKALNFALLHEVRIMNLSLGGPADRLLQTLVQAAERRGVAVVGAVDPARPAGFPGAVPGVLAVAMPDTGASLPPGTLLAPGADVPTCLPGARWGFVSGSSFAAAEVSGLVALLAQRLPHAGPGELRASLATDAGGVALRLAGTHSAGPSSGVTIDACASLARATGACVCSCHAIEKLNANRKP